MSERMSGMRRAAALTGIAVAGGGVLPATGLGNGTEGLLRCVAPQEAGVNPSIAGNIGINQMRVGNTATISSYRVIAGPNGALLNGTPVEPGATLVESQTPLTTPTFLGPVGTRGTVSVEFEHPVTSVVADDAELIVGKTTTAPVPEGVSRPRKPITGDLDCTTIPKPEEPKEVPKDTPKEVTPVTPEVKFCPVPGAEVDGSVRVSRKIRELRNGGAVVTFANRGNVTLDGRNNGEEIMRNGKPTGKREIGTSGFGMLDVPEGYVVTKLPAGAKFFKGDIIFDLPSIKKGKKVNYGVGLRALSNSAGKVRFDGLVKAPSVDTGPNGEVCETTSDVFSAYAEITPKPPTIVVTPVTG